MDFTLRIFKSLLFTLKKQGYQFFTFEEYCNQKVEGNYVIMRHDVDLRINNSFITAQLEAEIGIKASYYFRVKEAKKQADVIRKIASLGHEIGYHYTDLVDAKGDTQKAIELFCENLELFRKIAPISSIAMHGSPTSKFDNRDIWKINDYRDYGIVGEPYFDIDFTQVHYLTDTGRMWDGERYNVRDKVVESKTTYSFHSTQEMIQAISAGEFPKQVMITTHPQRWTDNLLAWMLELVLQGIKNRLKRLLLELRRYSLR